MAAKLRWGVLGTAWIAREQVIPAIQQSVNGEIVALASRDRELAKRCAAALGVPKVIAGYDALLDDPDIDAVYIPLPNSEHGKWVRKAAAAGKAILCEKPLALNADEARDIVDFCGSRNVPLMEGFMYRFHPQNLRALDLVKAGAIGEVREIRAHLSVNIMDPPDPGSIRFNPTAGGGTLLDMGCYASSIARWILGEEPVFVQGWLDIDIRYAVDTTAAAILAFSSGRVATVTTSFRANAQGAYTVVGANGAIEVPRAIIPGLGTRAAEGLVILVDADGNRQQEVFAPANQYRLMVESFAAAVQTGAALPLSPADSVLNMAVLDAIVVSNRTGKRVPVAAK